MEMDLGRGHVGHPAELPSIRNRAFDVMQIPAVAEWGGLRAGEEVVLSKVLERILVGAFPAQQFSSRTGHFSFFFSKVFKS